MNTIKILTEENPILRKQSSKVDDVFDNEIATLIKNMVQAMKDHNGIGLAAPQIGVAKRVIAVEMKDGPYILINPKITKYSLEKEKAEEGCLSVPKRYGDVERSECIEYQGLLPNGNEVSEKAEGLFARVIQHEIDHLDGILFIDKIIDDK